MKLLFQTIVSVALIALNVSGAMANDDFITVNTLKGFNEQIKRDGIKIRLEPKEYTLEEKDLASVLEFPRYRDGKPQEDGFKISALINFSGSNNTIDMTGATIRVDTRLFRMYGNIEIADALISGNDNYIKGLKLVDFGNQPPMRGSNCLYIMGDRNTVTEADLYLEGSSPYGYGHLLGKGGGSLVKLQKHCGLLIAGIDTKFLNSKILTHAYGHGIYLQGAVNTWIENCVVEGRMRSTDEMLAERSGAAFDIEFSSIYPPGRIIAGEMKSLAEDAYRIYASGVNGRKTVGLSVVNCKAIKMRTGFDVSLGTPDGDLRIIGCEAIECQFGYSLNSGAVVERCKGDIKYGPVLTFPYPRANGSRVEIEITEGECSEFPYPRAAEINGQNHDITLTASKRMKGSKPIVFGESFRCDVGLFRDPNSNINNLSGASNVTLKNNTKLPTIINERSSHCNVKSKGAVERL